MSAQTRALLGKFFYEDIIRLENLSGNHLSPWMRTCLPSPIRQIEPLLTISLALRILCHAYDPESFTSLSKIEQVGKNFALNTLYSRELVL